MHPVGRCSVTFQLLLGHGVLRVAPPSHVFLTPFGIITHPVFQFPPPRDMDNPYGRAIEADDDVGSVTRGILNRQPRSRTSRS